MGDPVNILLTADWHVRGDCPRCRIDEDWLESQRKDIQGVRAVADSEGCDEVWILGDLFHQPRVATEAVVMVLDELRKFTQTIRILPGNHDLPHHSYENRDRSSLGVVLKSYSELTGREVEEYPGEGLGVNARPFGMDEDPAVLSCDVWATHRLVFKDESARPMKGLGWTAQELLDAAPGVRQMIVTGDYHHGYIHTGPDGRRVVTPGCLNIQAADMVDYQPRVYVWDTASAELKVCLLKSNTDQVVTDYLAAQREKDARMEQVLEAVRSSAEVSLDFLDNLEKAAAQDSPGVRGIIGEVLDNLNEDRK